MELYGFGDPPSIFFCLVSKTFGSNPAPIMRQAAWSGALASTFGHESIGVDFVPVENRRPFRFVECKWGDAEIGLGLQYLKARFPECEAYQVSAAGVKDYQSPEGIRVCPALELLRTLI